MVPFYTVPAWVGIWVPISESTKLHWPAIHPLIHFPVGSPPLSLQRRLRTTPSPWCSATTAPLGLDRLGLQVLLVLRVLHGARLTSDPNESWFTYSLVRTFGSLWLTINFYQLWFLVNISVVSFINQQTHFCGGAVYRTWGELQASLNTLIYTFTNVGFRLQQKDLDSGWWATE